MPLTAGVVTGDLHVKEQLDGATDQDEGEQEYHQLTMADASAQVKQAIELVHRQELPHS